MKPKPRLSSHGHSQSQARSCAVCGTEFLAARSHATYCSPACYARRYAELQKVRRDWGWHEETRHELCGCLSAS